MAQLSPWRDLARKAAQALKRQLAQTESGLSALLNPARSPRAIPVPLPQRRAPRFPGDKRFYTQSAITSSKPGAVRSTSVANIAKTEFGRTLTRPRLSSGTIRSHGYGRSFSTSTVNHAHVAREVYQSISQGIRAGVLNTPFFPPSAGKHHPGKVMHGIHGHENTSTVLSLPIAPPIILSTTGVLSRSVVNEIDEVLCSTPQFLAKLRRDLHKLMRFGEFEYTLVNNNSAIEIVFHGKDRDYVEGFLRDVCVTSGTLVERNGLLTSSRDDRIDWPEVYRSKWQRHEVLSEGSLDRYVHAIDVDRYGGSGTVVV